MNGYAKATGRGRELFSPLPLSREGRGESRQPPARGEGEKRTPPPLSPAAQARVADTRRLIHQHMPEMIQIIKDLTDEGLIDGWRNVTFTEYPIDKGMP